MITVTRDKIDELAAYYDEHDTTADLERAVPREPVSADEVMIVTSLRLPKRLWFSEFALAFPAKRATA